MYGSQESHQFARFSLKEHLVSLLVLYETKIHQFLSISSAFSTFASDTVGCQQNQVRFFFISNRASHLYVPHLLLRRKKNKHIASSKRRLGFQIRESFAIQRAVASRIRRSCHRPVKRRKRRRVDEGKPATCPRDAVVPPGFRLFPFVPLHAQASQETRIPRCHPITRRHRVRASKARPGTRDSDLPVVAPQPPWLHSALAMLRLARSTAAACRVPVFLATGPHFTRCPVPCSPARSGPDVGETSSHLAFPHTIFYFVRTESLGYVRDSKLRGCLPPPHSSASNVYHESRVISRSYTFV